MPNYYAEDGLVQGRQLRVQRLTIPFLITGNATSANVVISCDEPAILFLKTQGVDQITPELALLGDSVASQTAPNDAAGTFDLLVVLNETVVKVMYAKVNGRSIALSKPATLDNLSGANPGVTALGQSMVLTCTAAVALNAPNSLDGCLEVEYVTAASTP